ncbi:hypothetical protein [Litorisediminicola beolgyonensis]|uniref:SpoVT-AbrB domain-containing protein n=1 Tax=Litorisediminicola beolgyonensis TaxID=1173614 RepID=A0ABW3ZDH0_9RHOB
MQSQTLSPALYNAAEEAFEAILTFDTDMGRVRVPTRLKAPVDLPTDMVEAGLIAEGRAALDRPGAMKSRIAAAPAEPPERRNGLIDIFFGFFGNRAA